MLDRVPPQSVEAEQAVLGAIFIENKSAIMVMEILKTEDFYREAHRIIFNAIIELTTKNEPADMITIIEGLRKINKLEETGGIAYITSLANSVPTAANIMYHTNIVKEKSISRQLINVNTQIAAMAYEGAEEVHIIKDKAEKMILEIGGENKGSEFANRKELVMKVFMKLEEISITKGGITGVKTHFKDLDNFTAGLQASDLILIAARPSMGKTALALNIAANVAMKEKKPVAVFSLEMSNEQLVQRMVCAEACIDMKKLRQGDVTVEEWKKIAITGSEIMNAPIEFNDKATTVMEIRSAARKMKAKQGLSLIVIDYIQLIGSPNSKKNENRQQEVSAISRALKLLAKELDVPVIALSQLSRNVEQTQSKKPQLSDLRESGALEQDADIVGFLYRDDYYHADSEKKNITEVIIAKHRNGAVGTIDLFFHNQFTRFADLSRKEDK